MLLPHLTCSQDFLFDVISMTCCSQTLVLSMSVVDDLIMGKESWIHWLAHAIVFWQWLSLAFMNMQIKGRSALHWLESKKILNNAHNCFAIKTSLHIPQALLMPQHSIVCSPWVSIMGTTSPRGLSTWAHTRCCLQKFLVAIWRLLDPRDAFGWTLVMISNASPSWAKPLLLQSWGYWLLHR